MVQRYNILGRYTNQYLCLCSHAWSVEVSHGKIRVRHIRISAITSGKAWILSMLPNVVQARKCGGAEMITHCHVETK